MIISKKKFNEAIEKAVREAEEKRWQYERIGEIERDAHRRMDSIERRISAIENMAKAEFKWKALEQHHN